MANITSNMRKLAHAGVGLAGLAIALATAPAMAADNATTNAPAADQSSDGGLQEIVVTAQHRSENLLNVPISINAISGSALASGGIGDTTTLVDAVPSLNFTRSGPSGIFVIRGVGTPNGAAGEEGSTAVYVDDVYMPDLAQTVNNFNNIQRVEVLNGPQGTLFGRNATAGLIHIITQDPGDHTAFKGMAGFSNYDTFSGQAYLTTPLADNVGWDIAFTGQNQGKGFGYDPTIRKDVRTDDHWGLRSKLVIKPSANVKVTLAGDYYSTDDTTATYVWQFSPTQQASQNSNSSFPSGTHIRVWGTSAKMEAGLGFANLTSITSYRSLTNTSAFAADGLAIDLFHLSYHSISQSFQQEVRLASTTTEPLSWQVGAFYLHSIATNDQLQAGNLFAGIPASSYGPFAGVQVNAKGVTNSVSAFGESTYAITSTTHLTGGVRWTSDRRQEPESNYTTLSAPGSPLYPNNIVQTQANPDATFDQVTYRAALRQDVIRDVNVYASVNRGFKSGEFNLQSPADPPVKPETIMAYEAGAKAELFDHRLRLNLAIFHYDIDNYQIRSAVGSVSVLANAAKLKSDGIDINTEAAVTPQLHLTAAASWLKSRFSQYGGPGAIYSPTNYLGQIFDATGNQSALSPHFTLDAGGSYTVPLGNDSQLRLNANVTHKSGYFFEADNYLHQNAYTVGNASIEYQVNKQVAFEVWGKNLGNKLYNVEMTSLGFAQTALAAPPRTYGIDFKFDY